MFSHTILRKHECAYFYCDACGFLQTETPYWLDEAYESPIAWADTGLVQRNVYVSQVLATLLFFLLDKQGKYLDVAGGYGLLTRLMRDMGFDFYWSDNRCENMLARGFEGVSGTTFTAVTAFEVMEHLHNPLGFIADTMSNANTRTMIFSTELFAHEPPKPDAWWYYTFETGQHISFYQLRTLQAIGRELRLNCYSNGAIHMLTDKNINTVEYGLLTNSVTGRLLSVFPKLFMVSKVMNDHRHILKRVR